MVRTNRIPRNDATVYSPLSFPITRLTGGGRTPSLSGSSAHEENLSEDELDQPRQRHQRRDASPARPHAAPKGPQLSTAVAMYNARMRRSLLASANQARRRVP